MCVPICFKMGWNVPASHHNDRTLATATTDMTRTPLHPLHLPKSRFLYIFQEKAAQESKQSWNRRYTTFPKIARFNQMAQANPMPSVGAYQITDNDVQDRVKIKTNWRTRKAPHVYGARFSTWILLC